MTKKYYKVVKKFSDTKYVSCRRAVWESALCTYYEVGQFVSSPMKGSKLFVFDDLVKAKQFANGSEYIFECECKGVSKYGFFTRTCTNWVSRIKNIASLRIRKKKWIGVEDSHKPVDGTMFADEVKLLKCVQW